MKSIGYGKIILSSLLQKRKILRIAIAGLAMAMVLPAYASTARRIAKPVEQSIDTGQKTQKNQEEWEARKVKLTAIYDKLLAENKDLSATFDHLSEEESKYQALNRALEQEKLESLRIQKEILPFLGSVRNRLELLVKNDAPFLEKERNDRLEKLGDVMKDIDVTIAEKFRKVMETLFVEAEYGNTIEVYQDKIELGQNEVLGNIFRLGRVSQFFLSLDNSCVAKFNVVKNQWVILDQDFLPALEGCVEMAAKRRPVELVTLPLGRLEKR